MSDWSVRVNYLSFIEIHKRKKRNKNSTEPVPWGIICCDASKLQQQWNKPHLQNKNTAEKYANS